MTDNQSDLLRRLEKLIWGPPGEQRPPWQEQVLRLVRTVLILVRDVALGQ